MASLSSTALKLTPTSSGAIFRERTPQKTRSDWIFSPWEGPIIMVPDPEFDFKTLLRTHIEEEEEVELLDAYDPLDTHSLLSSPPSSHPSLPEEPPHTQPPSTTPPEVPQDQQPSTSLQTHSKQQSRKNRKRKCQEAAKDFGTDVHPHLKAKHVYATGPIMTDYNIGDAPYATSGYVGLREESWKQQHTLDELVGPKYNFCHYEWQGKTPTPVVNQQGHVISVLAGHPDNPSWETVHHKAMDTLEALHQSCKFSEDQRKHRHGKFPALSIGISFSSGQTHPQNLHHNLHHNSTNTTALFTLINTLAFICLARFASSAFSTWILKTYRYYATYLHDLLLHDLTLVANWIQSVFAAATFNFSPYTLCFRHTDSGNLPFGWCAITALGRFDP
ncbi:hypothetical protein ARMGADRAFT_1091234 [Armillaria gallica]|uniref:Uncharacterized protein n=1 Tax=Armillaria gallica TaxID=47427 RepID=A0A2H3CI00_ARMGA|nr:hypothetical protein ARMGADRAFT_1091234 [Armillaria gallica]